ncbi:MAG: hypothetical protein JW779_01360 [Candidatus Thorarchaeota archaeon]|nr:hypothetical protein [Candidatus Thorarchaeota archaeon]
MVDTRRQIEDYLSLLDMKFTWDEKTGSFSLLFNERKDAKNYTPGAVDDDSTFKYTITIKPGERWIQIYADVYPIDQIPTDKRQDVFLDLLKTNRTYAEVCFDFDESRKTIGTSQEMMIQGLNFDGFREEFLAVPWAVKKFWTEIAKKHKLV